MSSSRFKFVPAVDTLAWVMQLLLGVVFLSSSWNKIQFHFEFLSSVHEYQLLGRDAGLMPAAFLPYLELVLGVLLIINLFPVEALVLVSLCCCAFVAAQAWAIYQGLEIACACFGSSTNHISYVTVGRTCGLLLAALLLTGYSVFWERRESDAACGDCPQEG